MPDPTRPARQPASARVKDTPPFAPPTIQPPLPRYVPATEGQVPRTHMRCTDCREAHDRAGERVGPNGEPERIYSLKWDADPYGLGFNARQVVKALWKRQALKLSKTKQAVELARVTKQAVAREPGATPLRVQSICKRCARLRAYRLTAIRKLEREAVLLGLSGATIARGRLYRTVSISGLSAKAMRAAFVSNKSKNWVEWLAQAGVVLMDSSAAEAEPVLPRNSVEALRVCYAALLAPNRIGPLRERAMLLAAIPKLVERANGHAMAVRSEDVVDAALVRENGALASVAMERLLSRQWRRACKQSAPKIKSGALDPYEASSRMSQGIFDGVLSWEALHDSGAALGTHVFRRVGRALQLRGRKDWAIAARKGDDGRWSGGAVSLEALIPATSDGEALVPHATSWSSAAPAPLICAERRNEAATQAARHDVSEALATLGETDREIATLRWMSGAKAPLKQVATAVGLPLAEVKAREKRVRLLLAVLLADYAKGGVPV